MRICIVARVVPAHGIGGMQDHTMDLARGLVAEGHAVDVITGRHPEGLRENEIDGARFHYVEAPTDFASSEWLKRSYEEFMGINVPRFDVVHSEGSSGLELVRRGVQREIPIVVMFHGNFVGLVKASLRRQVRGGRPRDVVREQRGLVWLARRHFAKGNWRVFRDCEAIVPSKQQVADTCRSHRLDPARVHVVPNGVDTFIFRPRPQPETRAKIDLPDGFLFVCAGRLNREKGMHHALHALALLRDSAPEAKLCVIGDGEERDQLERLASDLRLHERAVFLGAQPPERMPLFLAAADAFLFPTERDEAAPLILPQAMACGIPVISTTCGGIPEVIDRPGENGLLVPPGDLKALVQAATAVHDGRDLRARLAKGALDRVQEKYTLKHMVEATLDVYQVAQQRLNWQKIA